jgi:hypothetical protein
LKSNVPLSHLLADQRKIALRLLLRTNLTMLQPCGEYLAQLGRERLAIDAPLQAGKLLWRTWSSNAGKIGDDYSG